MEMTQAQFAVTVLETAVTTVARYETSHPPQGDLLLRLGEIAERRELFDLRDVFRGLFLAEVKRKLGFDAMDETTEARMARLELSVSQALVKLDQTEKSLVEIANSMLAAAIEANCTAENAIKLLEETGAKVVQMLRDLHGQAEPKSEPPQIM